MTEITIEYTWHTLRGTDHMKCWFGDTISDGQDYVIVKPFHKRSVQLCYVHANPLIPYRLNERENKGKRSP